jgi:hypothetical protein
MDLQQGLLGIDNLVNPSRVSISHPIVISPVFIVFLTCLTRSFALSELSYVIFMTRYVDFNSAEYCQHDFEIVKPDFIGLL